MVQATHDEKYRTAVLKGIDYILKAQYPNGGWPQFYPPRAETPYQRYITFNDDAMVSINAVFARGLQRQAVLILSMLIAAKQPTRHLIRESIVS